MTRKVTSDLGSGLAGRYVRLQDGATVREFRAREVSGEDKRYYWLVAARLWPHFPEYRRLAGGRDIPIMVLEPIAPTQAGTAVGEQTGSGCRP
jgi:F420H(2)-dependent quinone reductase